MRLMGGDTLAYVRFNGLMVEAQARIKSMLLETEAENQPSLIDVSWAVTGTKDFCLEWLFARPNDAGIHELVCGVTIPIKRVLLLTSIDIAKLVFASFRRCKQAGNDMINLGTMKESRYDK